MWYTRGARGSIVRRRTRRYVCASKVKADGRTRRRRPRGARRPDRSSRMREHLVAAKVTCVVIESTSDYWKPFYYLLDDELDVMLVNAAQVRNLPGRKTDCRMRRGWRIWVRTGLSRPPSCRRRRSGRCGI